ncbi:MAG: hypothetical protein ABJ308_10475 [Halieaceae bacterium]
MLLVLALPLYNYVQDYYGVYAQRGDWRGVVPNERFLKYQSVLTRPEPVESLLFGSSKAANIPFYSVLGPTAYNFAYSEGLPRDHLQVLTELVDQLPALQTVYIAIDDMSYLLDPGPHQADYLRRQHPAVAGIPRWQFFLSYLQRRLSNTDAHYFFGDRRDQPQVEYQFASSGRSLCPDCDQRIADDPAAHAQQPFFRFPYNPPDSYGIARFGEDLRALKQLLDARNIELVLFLQPSFANNLRWHNLGMLEQLKQEMASVAPFFDFLVFDQRLADTANFYDVVHFRPPVGRQMMAYIDGSELASPGEFGFQVSAETLDQHNAAVRAALIGTLVPERKYLRDLDYSLWSRRQGFSRAPLAAERASAIGSQPALSIACQVDSVNRRGFDGKPVRVPVEQPGMLELSGWAGQDAQRLDGYLLIEGQDFFSPDYLYPMAAGLRRLDVAQRKGQQLLYSGFQNNSQIDQLQRGNYRLRLLFGRGAQWFQCDNDLRLSVY